MTLHVKDRSVNIIGLDIKMRPVLIAAEKVWNELGQRLVVTSARDGYHSAGSLHYYGYAVDLRSRYFTSEEKVEACDRLRDLLGSDYDVVNELTHIHVEYDPNEEIDRDA